MKQFYCNYKLWEDYLAGMYRDKIIEREPKLLNLAKELLSNQRLFYISGTKMVTDWNIAAKINLTNLNRNRRAWIGQATCCHKYNIPENITKSAWNSLNQKTQIKANNTADKIIYKWELKNNAKG